MPTYKYECARCEALHEIFHSISDVSPKKCPVCGGELSRHVGGAGGVLLKGSGFHSTDYRSASYRKKDATPESPKTELKGDGAKDGKKDVKPPSDS